MLKKMKKKVRNPKLEEITRAREKRQMSIRDLAKRLLVSHGAVAAYERGAYAPVPAVWEKLRVVLGLKGTMEDYWPDTKPVGRPRERAANALCEIAGCSKPVAARGMCWSHYQKERAAKKREAES